MITWQTTVAPETWSAGTTSRSSIAPNNPGAGVSITDTRTGLTSSSCNWSQTVSYSDSVLVGFGTTSGSTVSILGTTDSTANGGLGISSMTKRSVINKTTTETVAPYTYKETASVTSETTKYVSTTTQEETDATTSAVTTTVESYETTTIYTTAIATTERIVTATTNGDETVATPIFATVVLAEGDEIIYTIARTNATDLSELSAAIEHAGTATRTTIQPWTQTFSAIQARTNETTASTLPSITVSFAYSKTVLTDTEIDAVQNYNSLPHLVTQTNLQTSTLEASATTVTVAPSSAVTFTGSIGLATFATTSAKTLSAYLDGEEFTTTTTATSTLTRNHTQLPTAHTSSSTGTGEVPGFSGTDLTPYTWTDSSTNVTSNELVTFATIPQGIRTSLATVSGRREFYSGVVDSEGNAALGYSCNAVLNVAFGLLARVSREVSSIFPKSAAFISADEENEFEGTSATFSNLSATISTTEATTTSSIELIPFGSALRQRTLINTLSNIDGFALGKSETIYQTLQEGVYSSGSTTFSADGHALSFALSGSSIGAALPLTHIVAATNTTYGDPVMWTTSRNSHPSQASLVAEEAYSAS